MDAIVNVDVEDAVFPWVIDGHHPYREHAIVLSVELIKLAKVEVHHVIPPDDEKRSAVKRVLGVLNAPCRAELLSLTNIVYLHPKFCTVFEVLLNIAPQVPKCDDDVIEAVC
jgi:hypothetical protein